ncbi:hypothetical protein [Lysinibacillus sphaericus]|uniref:hypothetical protein n=1 Tax=Lysinibacillus sphaericus TaxID=1421 RepID=UPI003D70EE44
MKVKIGLNGEPTETWENVKQITKEEHGISIVNEQNEELFIPYVNLSFYLVKQ